ncbi:MAG: hypothetical protein MZU97_25815 [Bacillus subtilis]|nr:hypothetical protein [Bacillus subtilis]
MTEPGSVLMASPERMARRLVLRVGDGYLQWSYASENAWTNLISLASLIGLQGLPGSDGRWQKSKCKSPTVSFNGDIWAMTFGTP